MSLHTVVCASRHNGNSKRRTDVTTLEMMCIVNFLLKADAKIQKKSVPINNFEYFCNVILEEMNIIRTILVVFVICLPKLVHAQDDMPTISPYAVFVTSDGEEQAGSYSGSAPLEAHFYANPENVGDWTAYYEWRFTSDSDTTPYLIRYEQDTDYTFTKSGSTRIECYAIFSHDGDSIAYTQEYWNDMTPITVSISESKLEMPNAFSPNNDQINDVYKAKEGYKSLVEFKAVIYNRWGQKLFEWTDPADGWDGKFNGKDVAEGVYFVRVTAKGADGIKYDIKRDVNLLRSIIENDSTNNY